MRALRPRVLIVAAIATVALAAGCGGDGNGDESSSPTEWADGVCTAITDWNDSLQSAADSLKGGNLSEESLRSAGDDVTSSTNTLADDLKGLGKPDTESGEQAKNLVDGLTDDIDEDVEKIESTIDDVSDASEVLPAVSTVTATLGTMGQQVSSTFKQLDELDPGGELEQAFRDADSCDELRSAGG